MIPTSGLIQKARNKHLNNTVLSFQKSHSQQWASQQRVKSKNGAYPEALPSGPGVMQGTWHSTVKE